MPKQRLLISNLPTSSRFFCVPSPLFLRCLFLSLRLLEEWRPAWLETGSLVPQCELALFESR